MFFWAIESLAWGDVLFLLASKVWLGGDEVDKGKKETKHEKGAGNG